MHKIFWNVSEFVERGEAASEQLGVDKHLITAFNKLQSRVQMCASTIACKGGSHAEHTQLTCHSHSFVKLPVVYTCTQP